MGLWKNCSTKYSYPAPAPDPRPEGWQLLAKAEYDGGHVLYVKYLTCTNFEGEKIMVYQGRYKPKTHLDPHFSELPDAPIARFRPDKEGWARACALASALAPQEGFSGKPSAAAS